jgi:hypothetical protein
MLGRDSDSILAENSPRSPFNPFLQKQTIIAAIAIPNLLRAKIAANEASAVGSLRTFVQP